MRKMSLVVMALATAMLVPVSALADPVVPSPPITPYPQGHCWVQPLSTTILHGCQPF